jgi:predicted nucleotide-binding protein (sugar kinase/HSP70/actin superfamily)
MHFAYLEQKLSIYKIIKIYHKYKKEYQSIPLKNTTRYKILLIGELYTLMDSNSSHNLERTLIKEGIEVIRYTNLAKTRGIVNLFGKKYVLVKEENDEWKKH